MTYTQHFRTPEETLYDHPEGHFIVSRHLEYIGREWRTYVHTEVYYFSPTVLRQMHAVFDELRPKLPPVIGAFNWLVGPREDHFMTRFGFRKTAPIVWDDGIARPLWLHDRRK
ncbi:hypothetical protein [Methylobacterium sp. Leaf466]|uniref:hypothetical protein n=1 Tax=Methylobacterium sp. Leaf466 TaxID=1736386 RepID=UPI0006F8C139|nr:hypothetical protein [Methylobacterium sp. Leaf466]KQT82421.1 hypothetical protein ASG59_18690 [Methylobacterium sp. Leaf466]